VREFVAELDAVAPGDRVCVGVSVFDGVPVGVGVGVGVPVPVGVGVRVEVVLGVGLGEGLVSGAPFSFINSEYPSPALLTVSGVEPHGRPVGPWYPIKPFCGTPANP